MNRILFYHPWPLAEDPSKGSEIRPVRMLEAFRRCGYEVDIVTGYSKKRHRRIKAVRRYIEEGGQYSFLYAESTTVPIPLTDPHHLPVRPIQDFNFFRTLRRHGIPIGLFYRDVYWQVEDLQYNASSLKKMVKRSFQWIEWGCFQKYVSHLFLPTDEIRSLLPTQWPANRASALPPGCDDLDAEFVVDEDGPLRLFYVGGVSPPYYDIRPLLRVVERLEDVKLTLCCRRSEWEENRSFYNGIVGDGTVRVVHASAEEIGRFYKNADLVADLRQPTGYLRTALPVKTVEAIGYGVPMLLRRGTSAATFVAEEGTGWVTNSLKEAEDLLVRLRDHRKLVQEKRKDVVVAQKNNKWVARAKQAASILRSRNRYHDK